MSIAFSYCGQTKEKEQILLFILPRFPLLQQMLRAFSRKNKVLKKILVVYKIYWMIFFLVGENPQHPIQGLSKATAEEEEEEILDSLALLLSLQMLPCFSFSRHLQPYSHTTLSHCTRCTCLFHTLPTILGEIVKTQFRLMSNL